ncbi:MAG: hypothetical protein HW412_55 [Bacteroidetes bacterium]|nr:hypothetical protein [Bacteroidota bacterium]
MRCSIGSKLISIELAESVSSEHRPFVVNITRYGLPIVVGIFYLTASRGFEYTSESTFQLLNIMNNSSTVSSGDGVPSPLWQFLLTVGGRLNLNSLLAAKVLGLVFSCIAILVVYLTANEILRDHLTAFCVSLVAAMQGWLLQIAPSGSPFTLAMTLTFAGLFFMLRNEYVVAPFMFGLCTLVSWQAVFFMIPLCVDIWMNSVSKKRAAKVLLSGCLVYLCALLPWLLFVWKNGGDGLPVLLPVSELPQLSPFAWIVLTLLVAVAGTGFVVALRFSGNAREAVRTHSGLLMFVVVAGLIGIVYHTEMWLVVIPVVAALAFLGLAELLKHLGHQHLLYSASFVLTGLLLVHLQLDYYRVNKPAMESAIGQATELYSPAEWLRLNTTPSQTVCAEHPHILEYYAQRLVIPLKENDEACGDFIVTSRQHVTGYEVVSKLDRESSEVSSAYAVWRKK